MNNNLIIKCIIAFIIGYLLAITIGDGFEVSDECNNHYNSIYFKLFKNIL